MKILTLIIGAIIGLTSLTQAQPNTPTTLTEPILSAYETRQIYAQAKLTVQNSSIRNECNNEVVPEVAKLNLGLPVPAILLTVTDPACYSTKFTKAESKYILFQRQGTTFKIILAMAGSTFQPQTTTTSGVTDIQVGVTGQYVPTWKWDGTKYSYGTRLKSDVPPSPTAPIRMEFDLDNPYGGKI